MEISDDTILRLLKRPPAAPLSPDVLHVVGIDDWAWQKGQHLCLARIESGACAG
jgi:hypothetical protein